jgi:hypothetical protein
MLSRRRMFLEIERKNKDKSAGGWVLSKGVSFVVYYCL